MNDKFEAHMVQYQNKREEIIIEEPNCTSNSKCRDPLGWKRERASIGHYSKAKESI